MDKPNELPCKTPLLDLLLDVPVNAVGGFEDADKVWHHTPYGRLCHEAAKEIESLRAKLAELEQENHNLNWALGTEGYTQMATPEQQAESDAAIKKGLEFIANLKRKKSAFDALVEENAALKAKLASAVAAFKQKVIDILNSWRFTEILEACCDNAIDVSLRSVSDQINAIPTDDTYLKELEMDKALLDWLEQERVKHGQIAFSRHGIEWVNLFTISTQHIKPQPTIRSAIAAAIEAEKGE